VIRAVFFDWFNTLARYEPPRETVLSQVLQELGYVASPADLRRSLVSADRAWYEENAASPFQERSPEERARRFADQQVRVLVGAGVTVPEAELPELLSRMRQATRQLTFALYDDVSAALRDVKRRNLTVGVLSNMRDDITPMCHELGMEPYMDFALTSGQAGSEKPSPGIFLQALERAGAAADEAIHVGDQYAVDVIGARGVGIAPILLDRSEAYPDVDDCPRIQSLAELAPFLG
jgi:HAD superfamily hydrolase (TIGR01549 family)